MDRLARNTTFGILAAAVFALSGPAWGAPPDKFLPPDTEVVVCVNVKGLLTSEIVKKYALEQVQAKVKEDAQITEILSQLNFNPLQDLDSVLVAVGNIKVDQLGGNNPRPEAEPFVIVHGKFDLERIHGVLAEVARNAPGKLAMSEYGRYKIYEAKEGDRPMFAVFLDAGTAVVADRKSRVSAAIDVAENKTSARLNKELATILDRADSKPTIWVASRIPATVRQMMKGIPQGAALSDKLEGMTFGVTLGSDAVVEMKLFTTEPQAAQQVRVYLEQGKALLTVAVLGSKEYGPILTDVIGGIRTVQNGPAVGARLEVSAEVIEKLAALAKDKSR